MRQHKNPPKGFPNVFEEKYWIKLNREEGTTHDYQTFNTSRYFEAVEKWFLDFSKQNTKGEDDGSNN